METLCLWSASWHSSISLLLGYLEVRNGAIQILHKQTQQSPTTLTLSRGVSNKKSSHMLELIHRVGIQKHQTNRFLQELFQLANCCLELIRGRLQRGRSIRGFGGSMTLLKAQGDIFKKFVNVPKTLWHIWSLQKEE